MQYTAVRKNPDSQLIRNHSDNRPYWATDKEKYYSRNVHDYDSTRFDYTSEAYDGSLTTRNKTIPFDMGYDPPTKSYAPSRPQYWLESGLETFEITPTKLTRKYTIDPRSTIYPKIYPFPYYNIPDYPELMDYDRLDPFGAEIANYDQEVSAYDNLESDRTIGDYVRTSGNIDETVRVGQYDEKLYYPGTKDIYGFVEYNGFGDIVTESSKMDRSTYVAQEPRTKNVGIMKAYQEYDPYQLINNQKKSVRPEPQYSIAQKDFLRRKFMVSEKNADANNIMFGPKNKSGKVSDSWDPRLCNANAPKNSCTDQLWQNMTMREEDQTQDRRDLSSDYNPKTWNNIDMDISIKNDPRMDIAKDYSLPLWAAQDFFNGRKNPNFKNKKGAFT